MGEYLFRFPSCMPPLTFEGLKGVERIGSTVDILQFTEFRVVKLYGLTIARIFADCVEFPVTDDHHQATREWLQQIVRDNGIGTSVYRNRNGALVIDGDRPLEGRAYTVTAAS